MRKFIEIQKIQTETQVEDGEPAEQVRVEIDPNLLAADILARIAALRTSMGWTADDSTARLHLCHHDDAPQQPCVLIPEAEIT